MATRRDISRGWIRRTLAYAATLLLITVTHPRSAQPQDQPECLRLGGNVDLGKAYDIYERAINAIYTRAGICAQSEPINPMRQSLLIASGALDGEWLRYEGYEKQFEQDLAPVPQPIFQLEAVFVRRGDSTFNGTPANLMGRSVAFVNGMRWIETHLPLLGATGIPVPNDVPVVRLLKRGRFDIFATHRLEADEMLKTLGPDQTDIIVSHWESVPFLHFLHRRHSDKLERLAEATRDAIAAGEMDELYALPGISRIELD